MIRSAGKLQHLPLAGDPEEDDPAAGSYEPRGELDRVDGACRLDDDVEPVAHRTLGRLDGVLPVTCTTVACTERRGELELLRDARHSRRARPVA